MDGKKTVKHSLSKLVTSNPIQSITQGCILSHCEPAIRDPGHAALRIQMSIRGQYYRVIKANPERALELTYKLNCPPCGFYVTPWTQPCLDYKVCPWCFTRRLLQVYEELMRPERKIRILHRLVAWSRDVPLENKLPFFRPDTGPHKWLNATTSVQMVVPYLDSRTVSPRLRHIGIHLSPKRDLDFAARLRRNCVNPAVNAFTYNTVNPENIYRVFNTVMRFPWLDLYLAENREHFENFMDLYPRQKLLRFSRYKSKGEECGN